MPFCGLSIAANSKLPASPRVCDGASSKLLEILMPESSRSSPACRESGEAKTPVPYIADM